jgi:putative membrane protein
MQPLPFKTYSMNYDNYQFGGMHFVWWFVWAILLFWIFATPYDIPGQRLKRETPLYMLKKRLASGQISSEEYLEKKAILDSEM